MPLLQELVEIVGRSTGIALMAPPTDSNTAQKTLDTLLSAVNKKQKVRLVKYLLAHLACQTLKSKACWRSAHLRALTLRVLASHELLVA